MKHKAILIAAVTSFIITGPTLAQDTSSDNIDNIVVTASRSPVAIGDVGSSITVIDREQIEARQARYVTDLLREVPGFSVSQSGTTGTLTQVRVRGSEANHVLVLIDGVRANDPAGGDEFRWEYLTTNNVERIEIVRGPQSSLWGSDAVSAVVHVITRSGAREPEFGAHLEVGSQGTRNGGLQGATGSDRWSLSYGLERVDTDGSNVSHTGNEDDESNMTTASVSARLTATEKLSFQVGARYVDAYSQFDPTDYFVTGLPTDGDQATDAERLLAHSGMTYAALDGRWVNHLNIRYLDTDNRNLTDGLQTSSTSSQRTTISHQSDIQIWDDLLSLALEREVTQFQQRGEVSFSDPNQDQQMRINSFIADYQGGSPESFTWLLSTRYDNNSDFDDSITGRLSVMFPLSDNIRVTGNLGTAQKTPTFIERFGFYAGDFIGNPDLKPETSKSFDLGIASTFFNDTLDLDVTVFREELQNEINGFVFDMDTFTATAENKSEKSTRDGIEIAASLDFSDALSMRGSYTYTDTQEQNAAGATVAELRRPRHVGSVSGEYRFWDDRAHLVVVADHAGSRSDIFYPPPAEPSQIVPLHGYWLVGLTAGYDLTRNFEVFVRLSNLLDEDYEDVYGYKPMGLAGFIGIRFHSTPRSKT